MPLLITQAEIESLPPDPRQRFVAVEEICRRRFEETVQDEERWQIVQDARLQYMGAVVGAARYLDIEPISKMTLPKKSDWNDEAYEDFVNELHFYTMQLALEGADRSAQMSILLHGSTRDRLLTLTSALRDQVNKLEMNPARLDHLLSHIEAFERELRGPRLTFARVATLTLYAAAAIADLGGAAQTVRGALNLIEQTAGQAKEEQDKAAVERLGVFEVKQITVARASNSVAQKAKESYDLNDDIPF